VRQVRILECVGVRRRPGDEQRDRELVELHLRSVRCSRTTLLAGGADGARAEPVLLRSASQATH
jgi:hypothetical protein